LVVILRRVLDRVIQMTSPAKLFLNIKPVIPFVPTRQICPRCGSRLKVQKTRSKDVFTLHLGGFRTHETVLYCDSCGGFDNYGSEELLSLVPDRCCFGFDVMVYVGQAMFCRHRCNHEIMLELGRRNIPISSGEIDYLGRKFIVYLAIVHSRNAGRIEAAMKSNGGFILHLDSTCDKGSPMLMCGIDSISDIVLGSIKIPSEKADFIVPFLKKLKAMFGVPIAVVQDMGKGIMNAVEEVFHGIRIFICHFHFLRDIGKDLFGDDYDVIRKRLRKHGITSELENLKKSLAEIVTGNPHLIEGIHDCVEKAEIADSMLELMPIGSCYTLILWILEGKKQGHGYGFPFDREHFEFSLRLLEGYGKLEELKDLELRGDWKDNKPFYKLSCKLKKIAVDPVLKSAVSRMQPKIQIFDKLRCAMRIAEPSGKKGLNDDGMDEDIRTIEAKVTEFRRLLIEYKKQSDGHDYESFLIQLDKYWDKLFTDPIDVKTSAGKIMRIQPQRTNNIMEHFFRDFKRGHIRKTGNNSMGKTIKAMIAETPLVKNLNNPGYMKLILGQKETLEELFAEIESTTIRKMLKASQVRDDEIPGKLKKIVARQHLPDIIINSFRKRLSA
jgi:hypothetical protein